MRVTKIPEPIQGSPNQNGDQDIPIPKWGSLNRDGDAHHKEFPNRLGDPRTEMGIKTSLYQNGDPQTEMGIVQSLTRIGLGFVPIWAASARGPAGSLPRLRARHRPAPPPETTTTRTRMTTSEERRRCQPPATQEWPPLVIQSSMIAGRQCQAMTKRAADKRKEQTTIAR
jgi:hypothetical protein